MKQFLNGLLAGVILTVVVLQPPDWSKTVKPKPDQTTVVVTTAKAIVTADLEDKSPQIGQLMGTPAVQDMMDTEFGHANWRCWDDEEKGVGEFATLKALTAGKEPCMVVGANGKAKVYPIDAATFTQEKLAAVLAEW